MTRPKFLLPRSMAWVALAAALALPLLTVAIWLDLARFAPLAPDRLGRAFDLAHLPSWAWGAGLAISLIGAGITSYGLLGLRRTFLEASEGRAFSAVSLDGFRRFAWVTLVMALYGIARHTALVAIFSAADPATPGMLTIQVGSGEFKEIFLALLLLFAANVFADAKLAKDENDAFL